MEDLDLLCTVAAAHCEEAEDAARLAPAVLAAAARTGVWALSAPEEVGGLELGYSELFTVLERLGTADATVAWHASNSSATGYLGAFLAPEVRDRVFSSTSRPFGFSGAVAAGVKVDRAGDGFVVDGTWPFMTGVADAEWATVVIVAPPTADGGEPDVRRAVIPVDGCRVESTWDGASAMRGTGSHAVTAEGLRVPFDATVPMTAAPLIDRPLYRWAPAPMFLAGAAAIVVGILRSALAGTIELTADKESRYDGHRHRDDPHLLEQLSDSQAAADALSTTLQARGQAFWATLEAGEGPDEAMRARFWATVFFVIETAADHVSRLHRVATSATYRTRNPVERALRDVHAISSVFGSSFQAIRRSAGSVMVGQAPDHPVF